MSEQLFKFSETSLSDAEKQSFKDYAIDAGNSFIAGKVTSAVSNTTKDITNLSSIRATTDLAAIGLGAAGTISQINPELINTIAQKIISDATMILTKETTKILGNYINKHTTEISRFPSAVSSYAFSYFNDNKKSIGDILKTLKESAESRLKKENEKNEKNNQKKFLDDMKKTMNKVNSTVTSYVNNITNVLTDITSYMEQGPDIISDQINKALVNAKRQVQKTVDKQWNEHDKQAYEDKIESLGTTIGQRMLGVYNNQLEQAQKILLEKSETKKAKAAIKLVSLKLKLLSNIASKTGLYAG